MVDECSDDGTARHPGDGASPMRYYITPIAAAERTARKLYRTRDEAKADVFDYIELFSNPKRRHSRIGYIFERQAGLD